QETMMSRDDEEEQGIQGRRPEPQPAEEHGFEERAPEPQPAESSGPNRLIVPGSLMIFTGVINLLIGVGSLLIGVTMWEAPDAPLQQALDEQDPESRKQLAEVGIDSGAKLRMVYAYGCGGGGGVAIFCGLLSVIGGVCMCAGKARGLAVVCAIVTMLPVA